MDTDVIVCKLGTNVLENLKILLERAESKTATPTQVDEVVYFIIMIEKELKLGDFSEALGDRYAIYNTYKRKQQINEVIKGNTKIQSGGGFGALIALAFLAIAITNAVGEVTRVNIEGTIDSTIMSSHTSTFREDPAYESSNDYMQNYGGGCGWLALALSGPTSTLTQKIMYLANTLTSPEYLSRTDKTGYKEGKNRGIPQNYAVIGYVKNTQQQVFVSPETNLVYTKTKFKKGTPLNIVATEIQTFQRAHIKDLLDKADVTDGYVEGEQIITFIMQYKIHFYLGMARRYNGRDLFAVMDVNKIPGLFKLSDPNLVDKKFADGVIYFAEQGFFEGTSLSNERVPFIRYTTNPIMTSVEHWRFLNNQRENGLDEDEEYFFEYEGGDLTPGSAYETFPILDISISTIEEIEKLADEVLEIKTQHVASIEKSGQLKIGNYLKPSSKELDALADEHDLITQRQKNEKESVQALIKVLLKTETIEEIKEQYPKFEEQYPELFKKKGGHKLSKRKTQRVKRVIKKTFKKQKKKTQIKSKRLKR